jgi:hypothetical protein
MGRLSDRVWSRLEQYRELPKGQRLFAMRQDLERAAAVRVLSLLGRPVRTQVIRGRGPRKVTRQIRGISVRLFGRAFWIVVPVALEFEDLEERRFGNPGNGS